MTGAQLLAVEESGLGKNFKNPLKTCLSDAYRL